MNTSRDRQLEILLTVFYVGTLATILVSFAGAWLKSDALIAAGGFLAAIGVLGGIGTAVWFWREFYR